VDVRCEKRNIILPICTNIALPCGASNRTVPLYGLFSSKHRSTREATGMHDNPCEMHEEDMVQVGNEMDGLE
ncbi:MAG TPA: hypothetical protein VHV83_13960, partial [Armatimonadota bacterium]|nr:hypothetical protein [Armatimonadota bacterium]